MELSSSRRWKEIVLSIIKGIPNLVSVDPGSPDEQSDLEPTAPTLGASAVLSVSLGQPPFL